MCHIGTDLFFVEYEAEYLHDYSSLWSIVSDHKLGFSVVLHAATRWRHSAGLKITRFPNLDL